MTEHTLVPYHLARLVLLIDAYSQAGGLAGLTKLAKLDFVLRYPNVLDRLLAVSNEAMPTNAAPSQDERQAVESQMIRWKYGPWDDRYYPLIGALLGTGLVTVVPGSVLTLRTTKEGSAAASRIREQPSWAVVDARCRLLRQHFNMTGNALRRLIYANLPELQETQFGRPI